VCGEEIKICRNTTNVTNHLRVKQIELYKKVITEKSITAYGI
jgi:hypothetical protein